MPSSPSTVYVPSSVAVTPTLIFSWANAVPESNRLPRAINPIPPLNIAILPICWLTGRAAIVAAFIASGIVERLADDGRSADIIGALSFTGSLILYVASQCELRDVVRHTCFELRMSCEEISCGDRRLLLLVPFHGDCKWLDPRSSEPGWFDGHRPKHVEQGVNLLRSWAPAAHG